MAIAERVSDVATPEQTRLDGFSGHDLAAVARDLVAILFAAAAPLEAADVARLLGVPGDVLEDVLRRLSEEPPLGLMIQRYEDRLQLTTAPAAGPAIERFLGSPPPVRLSRAALEALAVVAYRQPVTRGDIDAVRGVNSDSAVATLLSRNLVVEVGRKDTIGRPALLAVTPECLQYLGVASLSDLPPLPDGTPPASEPTSPATTSPDTASPDTASSDTAPPDSASSDTAPPDSASSAAAGQADAEPSVSDAERSDAPGEAVFP